MKNLQVEGKEEKELSSQEKMIKDVFDNEKFLTEESEINYKCNSCGQCCQNQNIIISTLDILRLRRNFRAPTIAFLQEYLQVYPGSNSKMPVCLLKFKEIPEIKTTICPFLRPIFQNEIDAVDRKNKSPEEVMEAIKNIIKANVDKDNVNDICSIHKDKPEICRLYPLGRGFSKKLDSDKVEMKFFLTDKKHLPCSEDCFGCEHKRTVGDLLKANNLGQCDKIQERYNKNIMNLGEISSAGKLSENEYSMLASLLYNFDAVLFYQKMTNNPTAKGAMEKIKGYKKLKDIYQDIPELDFKLLTDATEENTSDEEIYKVYEHIVNIQTLVIDKLVQKYGNGDKKN